MGRDGDGLVIIYTGRGKGKTTAALGLAVRAAGHDLRVAVVQFVKGKATSGEQRFAERWAAFPIVQFIDQSCFDAPEEDQKAAAGRALLYARELLTGGRVDVLVLDEAITAVNKGLLQLSEVEELLEQRPRPVDLVLTGREAPQELIGRADLVTEMREVKHPFQGGRKAREGIDY
jgi:cob(I)alamin adenosyltransferase